MAPKLSKSEVDLKPEVVKILTKRFVIRNEINSLTYQIQRFSAETPRVRRFALVEEELSNKIKELRKTNSALLTSYINHDLKLSDADINADQKEIDVAIIEACDISDAYWAIIDAEVGPPHMDPPSATMEGILTSLVSSNKKMADSYAKKKSPDVAPPSFSPSETSKDYF